MKKLLFSLLVIAFTVVLGGCQSSKQIPYFTNIDSISLEASRGLFDAKIMPKDMLTITVHTTDPAASAPFNLAVQSSVGSGGSLSSNTGNLQGYLVDNDGFINFPIIGKIHVVGLTKTECEDLIKSKIQPYLALTENPIVTVQMSSYRITVLGEVKSPGVIPVSQEKMSILEAIASAGDLSLYGRRDNVLLIREDQSGEKHKVRLNLNDANLINSPYYYMQQNDVLYVQPNNVQAKNSAFGQSTSLWFSLVGIVTSVASLLVNILRN